MRIVKRLGENTELSTIERGCTTSSSLSPTSKRASSPIVFLCEFLQHNPLIRLHMTRIVLPSTMAHIS